MWGGGVGAGINFTDHIFTLESTVVKHKIRLALMEPS